MEVLYNMPQRYQVLTSSDFFPQIQVFVRMELSSTWGTKSGNYILIKKIFFEVADIV